MHRPKPAAPIPIPADLPPTAAATTAEHPWPLRLLSAKIGEYIGKMSRMWVEGEITSIKRRPNARWQYFKLADLQAQPQQTIDAMIMSQNLPASITEGMHVVMLVKPNFWEQGGSFKLITEEIRPRGVGDILARLEALKAKLTAEGLFAQSRKKPLPFLPRRIGLICGRNTEAERDVRVNAAKRWPGVQFAVRQVLVQGAQAPAQIIGALAELDAIADVDVIVLARGGGSQEDLLPFSDEALIRAVASAHTPIVSAIGHEADNPLLDFVADVRASTPTDAARRIVPDVAEERRALLTALARGRHAIAARLSAAAADIAAFRERPALRYPQRLIEVRAEELANTISWGRHFASTLVQRNATALSSDLSRLWTLSPLSTLKRGYSILRDADGSLVGTTRSTSKGARLQALMQDGELTVTVQDIFEGGISSR